MFKLTGPLKKSDVPLITPAGEKSEVRAIDPKDFEVIDEKLGTVRKIKTAVQRYVKALRVEKLAKTAAQDAADVVRAFVGAVREMNAQEGDYQKTFRVAGPRSEKEKTEYAVDVSENDRWSIPKKKTKKDGTVEGFDMEDVRKALGDDIFDENFEEVVTIAIKKDVMDNAALRRELSEKLVEAFGKEGIKTYFTRDKVWTTKPGLEQRQYSWAEKLRKLFRSMVKPYADTVKDKSQKVK